jgi:alpha-ribazole phosphatase/probable phosphoglycerate mutase
LPETKLIDLMRHGEPVGGRRYRGQIDDPLSEPGWAEMRAVVTGTPPWDSICSSPLRRCSDFARDLAERSGIPLELDTRLREVGFGSWEGRTADQIRAEDPESIARFYHDPIHNRPQGAEPLEHFSGRVAAAFRDLANRPAGRHTLLVTHAGVIRSVITHVLNAPLESMYRISVETASLTRIRCGGERPPTLVFQGRRRL